MMRHWGLTMEDYNAEYQCDVCEDNWRAVLFFDALGQGSWNMSKRGPTGLKPESFTEVKLALKVTPEEWPELFQMVKIMEGAALEEIYKE